MSFHFICTATVHLIRKVGYVLPALQNESLHPAGPCLSMRSMMKPCAPRKRRWCGWHFVSRAMCAWRLIHSIEHKAISTGSCRSELPSVVSHAEQDLLSNTEEAFGFFRGGTSGQMTGRPCDRSKPAGSFGSVWWIDTFLDPEVFLVFSCWMCEFKQMLSNGALSTRSKRAFLVCNLK